MCSWHTQPLFPQATAPKSDCCTTLLLLCHPGVAGLSHGVITSSSFRTYHTALNHQNDFINALRGARDFVATARKELGLDIYPYSIFHIFFEQYLNVKRDAMLLIGLPCLAVFAVCCAFTGTVWGSAILLLMLVSLLIQLAGAMYLAGIQVNAGEFKYLISGAAATKDSECWLHECTMSTAHLHSGVVLL